MKLLSCLLVFILCLVPASVFSQSTSATISGGITDASGNFITGASVNIANDETGVLYAVRTNSSGMYFVPILPPGHYHVQVSKQGFKTIIKSDVVLNVQSAVALNFVLPIGATSQSITVEAGSSLLNTTDASVSTVIDRKFVENMPLNGRSFQDLISMTPGVVTQSPQTSGQGAGYNGDFSVNGQRTESNYYTVDGISANVSAGGGTGRPRNGNAGTIAATTTLGTTQSLVSVDAMQEFRVLSSTYSAEYGRSPGGQFSLSTRAGTNGLHGTLFDYLRNNYFDANDWFNNHYGKLQPALRQNDFGGTLGGPILFPRLYDGRDRSFFFLSYEGLRLTQPQPATIQYVPSLSLRQSVLQAVVPFLSSFPLPTGAEIQLACTASTCPVGTPVGTLIPSGLSPFVAPYSIPSRIDSTSLRIDHTISPKLTLFFRFGNTPSSASSRVLSAVTNRQMNTQTYTGGATSQLSPKASNEFRLGYAQSIGRQSPQIDGFGGAMAGSMPELMGIGQSFTNPEADFAFFVTGVGDAELDNSKSNSQERQWNVVDAFTLGLGRHQLKAGMDYRRITSPLTPADPYVFAEFFSAKTVLANKLDYLFLSRWNPATPVFNEFAAFAQDEWKVSSRVNLSLGIRWEVDPPLGEAHGNLPYTLLGDVTNPATLTLAPKNTPLWATSWSNFAPRLGAAWQLSTRPDWQTVFRAGGGVFFDTDNQEATQGFQGIGFRSDQNIYGIASVPLTAAQLNFSPSAAPPYTSATVFAFPQHLQLPYTLQWNTSLEQALGKNQSLTLSYVGSNGRRLLQLQASTIGKLNSNFNSISYFATGVCSNYQALQIKFQRSVAHGLHALASYTWSHSLDFGSNDAALPLVRGNSDFDVRNNIVGGLTWDDPIKGGEGVRGIFLGDWGLDLRASSRSAFPLTLNGNYLTDVSTGANYYSGLNLAPNQPLYLHSSQYPGGRVINKGAFSLPAGTNSGNAPRNFVRGFDSNQFNFAVRRAFPLHDHVSLQFRAEAFNILNHPSFGYVDPSYTSATFGQATQMLNSSLGSVASQYQQGGVRSMQFALKLLF